MKEKGKKTQKRRVKAGGPGSGKARPARGAEKPAAPARTQALLRAVFVGSRDAIGVSKAGVHVIANPAYRALFGYPPNADLAGKPVLDLIAPERRDEVKAYVARREQGGSVPATYETLGLRVDGSSFDMEVSASTYREGEEILTLVVLRDITALKRAAREIAERGATLKQIMNTASVAIFLVDKAGRITNANRRMAEMFGCATQDLVESEYVSLIHPSEREIGRGKMLALLASDIAAVDLERRYWRRDGTEFWGHLAGRRYHDVLGNDIGLIGVITDIDKRKRSEASLKQSEEKYRRLYHETPVLLHSIDRDARLVEVNDYWLKVMGYARDEVLGRKVTDFYTEASRKYARETVQPAFFRDGVVKDVPHQFVRKDGSVVDVLLSATAERDPAGAVVRSQAVIVDITEHKQAEQALRESEQRYRAIVESQAEFIVRYQPGGIITFVNDTLCRYIGMRPEDLLGRSYYPFMHPDDRGAFVRGIEALDRKGPSMVAEARVVLPDGRVTWHQWNHLAIFSDRGDLVEYQCTGRDVTERRQAEELLRESEEKYKFLIETTKTGYVIIDDAGRVVDANAEYIRLSGHQSLEDIRGRNVAEWTAAHDQERGAEEMKKCAQAGFVRNLEIDYVHRDGRFIPVEINATITRTGDATRIFKICRDITDRKQAEQALRQSEKLLQTIIDAEPECVKLLDENANLILMNRAGLNMLDADSLEQVKGQCVCPLVTSEYRKDFLDMTKRVFQGESGTLMFELVGLKGRHLWMETHAVPLRNDKEEIVAFLGVTRDITERKRAEDALRQSETRFRTIIEHASSGILVADVETRKFTYANPEICHLLGYTGQELLSFSLADLVVPGELRGSLEAFQSHAEGKLRSTERTFRRKDGSAIRMSINSVRMELGGRPSLVGFFTDITEKQLLEEERLRSQKLESIGTLAGGIAHDFNNLLQGIFGYISMAKLTIDQRERSLAMLQQAEKALHQSVNLTSQLLTFSKGGKPVRKAIDLRPVIENAAQFALSGSRVSCDLSLDDGLFPVEADEGQIGQVVQNIVLNAEQAMPLGGKIAIAARNVPPSQAAGTALSAPDGLVVITVRDQGTGIPPEHLPRIFDPYFTTKEKGSGLGLATSYSIVKNHDGTIEVASVLGKGSTFTIYLPATREAPESAAASVSALCAIGRKFKVLVMDDEPVIRVVAAELLRELGHEAEFAEHGASAIEKYRQARSAGRPFDAVILDMTIRGGMGGEEALRKLLEIDPGVKAVVSSGYSDDEVVATYRQHGFRAFLKKPYTIQELGRVLNEILA